MGFLEPRHLAVPPKRKNAEPLESKAVALFSLPSRTPVEPHVHRLELGHVHEEFGKELILQLRRELQKSSWKTIETQLYGRYSGEAIILDSLRRLKLPSQWTVAALTFGGSELRLKGTEDAQTRKRKLILVSEALERGEEVHLTYSSLRLQKREAGEFVRELESHSRQVLPLKVDEKGFLGKHGRGYRRYSWSAIDWVMPLKGKVEEGPNLAILLELYQTESRYTLNGVWLRLKESASNHELLELAESE